MANICFTGKLSKSRSEIEKLITSGSHAVEKRARYCDYIVIGDLDHVHGDSSKLRDAKSNTRSKVMTEWDLYAFLNRKDLMNSTVQTKSKDVKVKYIDTNFVTSRQYIPPRGLELGSTVNANPVGFAEEPGIDGTATKVEAPVRKSKIKRPGFKMSDLGVSEDDIFA